MYVGRDITNKIIKDIGPLIDGLTDLITLGQRISFRSNDLLISDVKRGQKFEKSMNHSFKKLNVTDGKLGSN